MPDERRGRLDRAIDRAVREMVQVDPLPGLRRRVDEQLHARAGSGLRRPAFLWPALAAATLMIVLVAGLLVRSPGGAPASEAQVAETAAERSQPVAAPARPAPTPAPTTTVPSPAGAPGRPPERAPARESEAIFGDRNGRLRAANLAAPAAGAVAPAVPAARPSGVLPGLPADPFEPLEPIAIPPIHLAPIAVSPVTVRPLSGRR
jgi:hypothetical protein